MRKTIAALSIAGALALGLTGCLPSVPAAPVETVTVEPAPVTPAPEDVPAPAPDPAPVEPIAPAEGRDVFRSLMGEYFGAESVDATETIALNWCAALDSGQSVDDAARDLQALGVEFGVPAEDLGFIVGAGVPAFCPQHQGAMDDFVAANS